MNKNARVDEILAFWFGRVEETIVPSEKRARIWFGDSAEIDADIQEKFASDLEHAIAGDYDAWAEDPHGRLALIILLDQYSRHIYRNEPMAYAQDEKALLICLSGLEVEDDHALSLIERVFYYFPLLHSENLENQERSLIVYQNLSELAFAETRVIYDSFLKFAKHHHTIIQRFGRFPQRNAFLKRESSPEEQAYLEEIEKLG